jgi:hypothetical protein
MRFVLLAFVGFLLAIPSDQHNNEPKSFEYTLGY